MTEDDSSRPQVQAKRGMSCGGETEGKGKCIVWLASSTVRVGSSRLGLVGPDMFFFVPFSILFHLYALPDTKARVSL